MRRSVRDAIVGFTLVGGVVAFTATTMWLLGVRASSRVWNLSATFEDASGLAERSAVTYRGIVVGSVRAVRVTADAVVADLEITNADLRLAQPVTATVASSSLLGANARVTLVSRGVPLPQDAPQPQSDQCEPSRQLCDGAMVRGEEAPSLASVTETLQQLLNEAQTAGIVPNLAQSTQQFERTAKVIEVAVKQLQREIARAQPMVTNLNAATGHVNSIVAAMDNPATLAELRQTAANAAQLSAKIDAVGGDVALLTADPAFRRALRNVTIGLGELFAEVYPAQTSSMAP